MKYSLLLLFAVVGVVIVSGCIQVQDSLNTEIEQQQKLENLISIRDTIGYLNVSPCTGTPITVWSKPDSVLYGAEKIGTIPDCQNIEVEVLERKCSGDNVEFDLIRYEDVEGWVTRRLLDCPAKYSKIGCFYAPDTICEEKGECPAGTTKIDDEYGVCGECISDSDCDSRWRDEVCLNNFCVECENDKDCPSTRPACDPQTNECVECTNNSYCDREEPICSKITEGVFKGQNQCVECATNSDCPPNRPVCRVFLSYFNIRVQVPPKQFQVHKCVECIEDEDCPSRYPACDFYDCVECKTDKHCKDPLRPACDSIFNRCVECTRDSYCTDENKPYCSSYNKCVSDYV